jgi:putative ABC transport system permease protein
MTSRTRLAFGHIRRQKVRSSFVVATFVAAVVVTLLLTSAVVGNEDFFLSEVQGLGINWIYVSPGSVSGPALYPLTQAQGQVVAERVSNLSAVAPLQFAGMAVPAWGGGELEVVGTNSSLAQIFEYRVAAGSFLLPGQGNLSWNPSQPIPLVVGYGLWSPHNLSVGQFLEATITGASPTGSFSTHQVTLEVQGLLEPRGSFGPVDLDGAAFVPLGILENLTGSSALDYLFASARSATDVAGATDQIVAVLTQLHDGHRDFTVANEQSWASFVEDAIGQFSSIITLVETTLLLLSAFSVFVVLSMAVKDRKREIGVLRALGAQRSDIMALFLLEASGMSLGGIAVGLLLGTWVLQELRAHAGGFYTYLETNPVALGVYFPELLGALFAVTFLFSLVPAYQASRLEAVEALRSS